MGKPRPPRKYNNGDLVVPLQPIWDHTGGPPVLSTYQRCKVIGGGVTRRGKETVDVRTMGDSGFNYELHGLDAAAFKPWERQTPSRRKNLTGTQNVTPIKQPGYEEFPGLGELANDPELVAWLKGGENASQTPDPVDNDAKQRHPGQLWDDTIRVALPAADVRRIAWGTQVGFGNGTLRAACRQATEHQDTVTEAEEIVRKVALTTAYTQQDAKFVYEAVMAWLERNKVSFDDFAAHRNHVVRIYRVGMNCYTLYCHTCSTNVTVITR